MTAHRLDHVAFAATTVDAATPCLERVGLRRHGEDETVEAAGALVRCFAAGEALVEVVAPVRDDSPLAPFLADRGPGLHHVALCVDDLDAEIARLRAAGASFLTEEPFAGRAGSRVTFVLPETPEDMLVELVEHP